MTEALGQTTFVAAVLWMHGESSGRIAKAVRWSRDKVRGFVWRYFEERPRGAFSLEERQQILDELKKVRLDNGRLRDEHFIALKTPEMYVKEPEKPAEPEVIDLTTRAGRRRARQLKREAEAAATIALKRQEAREAGLASRRGRVAGTKQTTTSSALEFLFDHRLLRDAGLEQKAAGREGFLPEETRRLEAGLRFRSLLHGARTSDLGAIDYERATMGAGGGPKLSLAAFKIHCIQQLGSLRKMMTTGEQDIIQAIVDGDVFIWETEEPGSEKRGQMYEAVRYFLDIICVHESLLDRVDFKKRWNDDLPIVEKKKRSDAIDKAAAAAEFMEAARA